ncbi:unnamed protein product [Bemisia tabaci]|uniref:PPM-type phosphatase domain-containing protein n=1 Tax=Bemisia tabaci TaxID=7038 RepID=A0A9P0A3V0_BEMTA|nr:unnamed protein product [Bemisia tabaci]
MLSLHNPLSLFFYKFYFPASRPERKTAQDESKKITRGLGWLKSKYEDARTTALVAVIEGSQLIVANVGDSRGVMCDSKGDAVPLSFDHKPDRVSSIKSNNHLNQLS